MRAGSVAAVVAAGAALVAAGFAAAAWLLMVLVGVWHGIRPAVPAIGFWEACVVLLVVNAALAPALASLRHQVRNRQQ